MHAAIPFGFPVLYIAYILGVEGWRAHWQIWGPTVPTWVWAARASYVIIFFSMEYVMRLSIEVLVAFEEPCHCFPAAAPSSSQPSEGKSPPALSGPACVKCPVSSVPCGTINMTVSLATNRLNV